jgi:DNA-binding MarR family transcriptional regulator
VCAEAPRVMGKVVPLSDSEQQLWRALMRVVLGLPRRLDDDLLKASALSAREYMTLVSLSEAPVRRLRMADLARAAALSASRMSRLVDALVAQGFVAKQGSDNDQRESVVVLTSSGLARLRLAWPFHLEDVRDVVFDHVDPAVVDEVAQALSAIAGALERRRSPRGSASSRAHR